MFRSEAEQHAESLTTALLALEHDPTATATTLDGMMRSAHSIKGAATLVRVTQAAEIAHVMEDCFVAAQKGKLTLQPENIDVLLRGVDLLVKITAATRVAETDWSSFQESVEGMVLELKQVLTGGTTETPKVTPPVAPPTTVTTPVEIDTCLKGPSFLNASAAEPLRQRLVQLAASPGKTIQLDLADTTEIDAIGLAFLSSLPAYLTKSQSHLKVSGVSPEMQTVLRVTGLATQYGIT